MVYLCGILSLFIFVVFCHCLSLTRNSIYSIHSSYYSIDLASCISNILIISLLILWPAFSNALVQIQQCSSLIDIATTAWSLCVNLGFIVVLLIWLTALNWMNDFWMESFLALSGTEQFSLIYSIKWLIVSECMLFFACFWSLINFRVISTGFSLFFSFPLFFGYSFGIPFSNLLILLFSGVPIQASQLFLKIGFLINTIEGLGQCLCCGWLFIILQLKEFLYSYFSLSDVMIGSIFYFTTGLHGFHVLFGSFGFFLTLFIHFENDCSIGSINLGSTLRSLFKGEHRGFCFELCGQGHSSMLIVGLIIILFLILFYSLIWSSNLFSSLICGCCQSFNSRILILYLFIF